ncbi:MAG: lipoyl(octanoyl) transferase, partial [Calditrichaeota bacterium]
VYTFGKSGKKEHLLIDESEARRRGIEIFWIDRGGDITFHGPGQLVGYPIFDLHDHYLDVGRFLRDLEECLIRTLSDFEIRAGRIEGLTGVWVENKKVAAIGVKLSRWITKHGFALNVNTNLSYFNHIVPCGISDKPVTSMQQLLGDEVDMAAVIRQVIVHFEEIFSIKLTPVSLEQIAEEAVPPAPSMDHFTGWAG